MFRVGFCQSAEVIIRMPVKDMATSTQPDANDAMVEDCAAKASSIGDKQRHFDRPHAAPDVTVDVVLFEPVSTIGRITKADVQPGAIQPVAPTPAQLHRECERRNWFR